MHPEGLKKPQNEEWEKKLSERMNLTEGDKEFFETIEMAQKLIKEIEEILSKYKNDPVQIIYNSIGPGVKNYFRLLINLFIPNPLERLDEESRQLLKELFSTENENYEDFYRKVAKTIRNLDENKIKEKLLRALENLSKILSEYASFS